MVPTLLSRVLLLVDLFSFLDRQILSLMVDDLKRGLSIERDFSAERYGVVGIRGSLLSTTLVAHLVATLLLYRGMSEYRKARDRYGTGGHRVA